ncbi:hypothetical protein NDU88_002660 [Pleurodeles waltl]|uniref:Uncharacterized protein n=1 Tax=Pleurodeles waltl TaxID=8319 RepID=A0AAV7WQI6_PLEWA|nr:hypothetical protein NDU88_002660 [Pleurodeles waltl]
MQTRFRTSEKSAARDRFTGFDKAERIAFKPLGVIRTRRTSRIHGMNLQLPSYWAGLLNVFPSNVCSRRLKKQSRVALCRNGWY